jgi:hypothetical protein
LPILGEGLFGHLGIGLHHVDRLDVGLEKAPCDVTPLGEQALGRLPSRFLGKLPRSRAD